MNSQNWEIGPIIKGDNFSVGMPLHPSKHPDGWSIDLPQPNSSVGHAHYITFRHGSLKWKTHIIMRYRIEMASGVRIIPTKFPDYVSVLTLYFQRAGDSWSGKEHETYRWWASPRSHVKLEAGEHEMIVRLDEKWTAVTSSDSISKPSAFQEATAGADRVGFTLGGGDGLGHGVYASGPARIVITKFVVE